MTFAPIVIPTLCRSETFIPCMESLIKCVGIEYTDVYIALDYPSKDSHWKGYLQILEYLENTKFPFKTLTVVKRTTNLGVYGPNSNSNAISKELWEKYDRLIFTEDDNIFSPNFLIYINKGLDLFEDDDTVDSISGYMNYKGIKSDGNTFYRCPNVFSAWGYATWKNRKNQWENLTIQYFRKSLSIKNLIQMYRFGRSRFLAYLSSMCPSEYLWMNDVNLCTYMVLESKTQIIPTISLVRNIGVKSGENFTNCSDDIANIYIQQPISENKTFEFIGTGYEFQKENIEDWVKKDRLFHEKHYWLTRKVVLKLIIKKTIRIILGDLYLKYRKKCNFVA